MSRLTCGLLTNAQINLMQDDGIIKELKGMVKKKVPARD